MNKKERKKDRKKERKRVIILDVQSRLVNAGKPHLIHLSSLLESWSFARIHLIHNYAGTKKTLMVIEDVL